MTGRWSWISVIAMAAVVDDTTPTYARHWENALRCPKICCVGFWKCSSADRFDDPSLFRSCFPLNWYLVSRWRNRWPETCRRIRYWYKVTCDEWFAATSNLQVPQGNGRFILLEKHLTQAGCLTHWCTIVYYHFLPWNAIFFLITQNYTNILFPMVIFIIIVFRCWWFISRHLIQYYNHHFPPEIILFSHVLLHRDQPCLL